MSRSTPMFRILRAICFPLMALLGVYAAALSLNSLLTDRLPLLAKYISLKGDPGAIRRSSLLVSVAESVKTMVPPDACIEVSRVPTSLLLSFRYYVYPLKFVVPEVNDFHSQSRVCNGHYFVDLNGQIKDPPANWHPIPLQQGIRLFAIGDSRVYIRKPPSVADAWSLGMYVCFVIMELLIGYFLLYGFIPRLADWPLSGKLGGSFLLGFIGVTSSFWILALLRCPLSDELVCGGMCILLFGTYFFMRKRRGVLTPTLVLKPFNLWAMALNLFGLAAMLFYVGLIVAAPVGIVDEVHIWLLKAKIFFDLRMLDFSYTEIITNYYPVFWPLNLTLQFIFTAGDHDQVAKWTSALIFISLLGLIKSTSMLLGVGRKTSWLVVFIFLLFFHHWTFFTALTENIFIALVLLSTMFFVDWLNGRYPGSLYAAAFSLVGLCGVKFEGTVIAGFFFVAFMLSQKLSWSNLWPNVKSVLPLSAALIVQPLWLCWLDFQGAHYSIFHLRREPTFENIPAVMQMTFLYLSYSVITVIIIFIALLLPRLWHNARAWSRAERFILFLALGMVLFAYSAGLCWLNNDLWQYYGEVWLRLVSRAMPLAVLLWCSRVFARGV